MSATDELRRLLDERGVEHYDGTECTLWDYEQTSESTGCYRCSADEIRDGFVNVWMHHLTPAQAIDATLWWGTCHRKRSKDGLSVRCELDVHYLTDEQLEMVREHVETLQDENAKLRELVEDMAAEMRGLGVDFKRVGWCDYADRMRELGIEINK